MVIARMSARIGGSARDYQGIFVALAAQQSRLWPNTADFRCFMLSGGLRFPCSVYAIESVSG